MKQMCKSIKIGLSALSLLKQGQDELAWCIAQLDPMLYRNYTKETWLRDKKLILEDMKNGDERG